MDRPYSGLAALMGGIHFTSHVFMRLITSLVVAGPLVVNVDGPDAE